MTNLIGQFILFFCLYAAYIGVCLLIGKQLNTLLFASKKLGIIQNVFLNLLFGDAVVVTLYSIVKSKFLTVNIIIAILLVVTIIIRKYFLKDPPENEIASDSPKIGYNGFIYTLIIIIPFIIRAVVYYNYAYHLPNIPQWDYQYYLTLSETFNQTGHENFFSGRAILFEGYNLVTPYRYHDIWLSSMFQEFHSLGSIGIYNLIVSSFTVLLSLLGLLSIYEFYKKISAITVVWTMLFLFTGFAYFTVANTFVDTNTPIEYQKLGMTYAVLSAVFIFFKKKLNLQAVLSICILFVYGVTGLSMITGLGLLVAGMFMLGKERKNYFLLGILPLLTIICFGAFYRVFGFKDLGIAFTFPTIKVFLYSVKLLTIKTFARYWYLYIWMIIVLIFNKSIVDIIKREKRMATMAIFFILFCIIFQAIIVNWGDSTQFATCNTSPLLHIMLFVFVTLTLLNISANRFSSVVIFILLGIYFVYSPYAAYTSKVGIYNETSRLTRYSKKYLDDVAGACKGIHNKLGLYWVDSSYFRTSNRMKEYFIRPGEYLKVIGNNFDLFCLSADIMPNDSDKTIQSIKDHSALFIFQKKYSDLNMTDVKLKFIKEYKFEYLIIGKNAVLPQAIDTLISKRITDSVSGDVFCLLRK